MTAVHHSSLTKPLPEKLTQDASEMGYKKQEDLEQAFANDGHMR